MNKRQFKKHPELKRSNIKQWKKAVDKIAGMVGLGSGYVRSQLDSEWLEAFTDWTPREAIKEELNYCTD